MTNTDKIAISITPVHPSDLDTIMLIEHAGFTPAEAGTRAAYAERIATIPDTFLVARTATGTIAGFICGPATKERFVEDWMYARTPTNFVTGGHQLVFTVAVAPEFRGQSIGSQLLGALFVRATAAGRTSMTLTCLADRIPFYIKNGFLNRGRANSTHGDEVWFNMEKVAQGRA